MKNIDDETLTFILKHGHLDRQELLKRGLDSSQPLKYADVVNHLAKVLQNEKWFPRYWEPESAGEAIYEMIIVERKLPFLFICHVQHHSPMNPTLLAERKSRIFFSAKSVARFYLKFDFGLPNGTLDGWKVVR
jgi:hypothetical protein